MNGTMKEVMDAAREIYRSGQCATGCCGDFEGAMRHVDAAVGDMIQGVVDALSDRDLTSRSVRVGISGFGFVVMMCEACGETFAKNVAGKTLAELFEARSSHACEAKITS